MLTALTWSGAAGKATPAKVVTLAGSCAFKPRSLSGKPTPALEGREAPERPLFSALPLPRPRPRPRSRPFSPPRLGCPAASRPAVTLPPAALLERESDERATAMVPPAAQPWSPPKEPARAAASLPAARCLRASSPCPGPAAAAPPASARHAARRH
ncbi:translation initiation factor IF-2-like [Leopardus geoffroyi]|uniref:translation initiation factor IF-2-like n=1 Tax=Leopardus geoffroyi TaxID=46844 RepID=UPI001E25EAB9|nr:translation initiation factor IF-2-like [Leopardus geoffroyi]